MTTTRRYSFLICSTLLCACAHGAAPAARAAAPTGPQAVVFEPLSASASSAPSRYAPTRSAQAPQYSWQNPTRAKCDSGLKAPAPEVATLLKFDGSVGEFPPLTAADEAALAAQPAPEAPSTWGSGARPLVAPVERRVATPDVVVASLRPAFRQCFSRWLDAKADAEGSVRFALELGCAGEVQAIAAEVKGVDESTVACLFNIVGPAQFEPPAGGHARLQVPVVFKNGAR